MTKTLSLKKILWIDCLAALSAGLVLLIFKGNMSPFFNVPKSLLTTLMMVAFCYACYSFYLANHSSPPKILLKILVLGNSMYALVCLFLLASFYKTATVFGVIYFSIDVLIVGFLALWEWRTIRKNDYPLKNNT